MREEEKRQNKQSKRNLSGGGELRTPSGRARRPSISDMGKGFGQSVKGFGMSVSRGVRSSSQGSNAGGSDTELGEEEDTVPAMLGKSPSASGMMFGEFKPMNRTDSFRRHGGTLLRVPSMFFMKALESQLKLHKISEERYHEALELAFQVDENSDLDGTVAGEIKAPLLIHGNDEDISFSPGSIGKLRGLGLGLRLRLWLRSAVYGLRLGGLRWQTLDFSSYRVQSKEEKKICCTNLAMHTLQNQTTHQPNNSTTQQPNNPTTQQPNNPPVLRFKLGDEVYNLDAQNTRFGSRITGTGNKKAVAKDKLQDHLDARGLGKDMDAIMDSTGSFKRREGQGSGPKRGQRKVRRLPF